MQHLRRAALCILLLAATHGASARIIFVDGSLAADCPASYDPVTRTCGGGAYTAFARLSGAANVATTGDTVVLRAGTYNEQLAPKGSGTAAAPVIYSSPNGETVVITGGALSPAIWVERLEHVVIQGLVVRDVGRWLAVLGSNHITIRSNRFLNANDAGGSSKTGLFFQGSDYNVVRDNVIDTSTQDNVALVDSDHNLIERNSITRAAHTLWAIKCGSYNVVRGNYFHNEYQKIGEIYDCDGVGYGDFGFPKLTSLDNTKYNVVENNIFAHTATPIDASPYAGIQLAGQHSLIRGNIFYGCIGPPLDLTLYADEARNTYGNRIGGNVFHGNGFGGVAVSGVQGAGYRFADNILRNNVFSRNRFVRYDTRWQWYATLDGQPVQIITGRTDGVVFQRNDLFNTAPNEPWLVAYGDRTAASNPPSQSIAWWEAQHPAMFAGTMQADPAFVDTAAHDFRAQPGSPLIDAGMFLTQTVGAGNSETMVVADAGWFRDGYGIAGLAGDTIQLQGSTQRSVIVGIDYATNTLTLQGPLSWANGQGVSLRYNGAAPDVGAFEAEAPSGIETHTAAAEQFVLFPNPTLGRVSVTFPPGMAFTPRVRAVNAYGDVVQTQEPRPANGSGVCMLDLSNQPAGVYMVLVESSGHVVALRCVRW